jgi:putative tricarboxylic transport membrane protein
VNRGSPDVVQRLKIDDAELWSGLIGLALGAIVVWQGYEHGIGAVTEPGTGFILFYVGWLMIMLSAVMLLVAIREGGVPIASLWQGVRWSRPMIAIGLLLAFALVFERLGFLLSTMALLIGLMRLIDPVPWRRALPIAVLAPLGSWFVIQKLLKIALPAGMFGIG